MRRSETTAKGNLSSNYTLHVNSAPATQVFRCVRICECMQMHLLSTIRADWESNAQSDAGALWTGRGEAKQLQRETSLHKIRPVFDPRKPLSFPQSTT